MICGYGHAAGQLGCCCPRVAAQNDVFAAEVATLDPRLDLCAYPCGLARTWRADDAQFVGHFPTIQRMSASNVAMCVLTVVPVSMRWIWLGEIPVASATSRRLAARQRRANRSAAGRSSKEPVSIFGTPLDRLSRQCYSRPRCGVKVASPEKETQLAERRKSSYYVVGEDGSIQTFEKRKEAIAAITRAGEAKLGVSVIFGRMMRTEAKVTTKTSIALS